MQGRVGKLDFFQKYFWKCSECITLVITYGKKGYRLWEVNHRKDFGNMSVKIYRDISGKIDLLKVIFHLYCFNFYSLCHLSMLS